MLEPVVRPFLNSPNDQHMVLQDENARLHRSDTTEEYNNQHHIARHVAILGTPSNTWGTSSADEFKPGTSCVHYSRALPSSTGEVEQGTRSKAHETSEFHDQQVASCNSTGGMIHTIWPEVVMFSVVPFDIFQHILKLDAQN